MMVYPFHVGPILTTPSQYSTLEKALQFINHNPKLKWISYFNDEDDHHLTSSRSSGEEEEFFTPGCHWPSTTSDDKFKEEFFALVKKALLDNYNIDSKATKDNKEHIKKMCKV